MFRELANSVAPCTVPVKFLQWLPLSQGETRASPPSPFSEIFFLLATWTLTKLCPRTRPGLTSVSRRRMIPEPNPPPFFHLHFQPAPRLPRFCFFILIPSPPLCPLQASPQLTYKLCFQVNFPGNAEFSKLRYSITPNSPPRRSSKAGNLLPSRISVILTNLARMEGSLDTVEVAAWYR